MIEFLVAFFGIFLLILLHEFSHFLVAKKFGVKVEEFGIGYPPRLLSKKIGETVYSLNLFLFGAFVRVAGETENEKDSFFAQPLLVRLFVALAGVFSFWLMAFFLFSFLFKVGTEVAIPDEQFSPFSQVYVAAIAKNSPAEKADLRVGDKILEIGVSVEEMKKVEKIKEIQEFTRANLGKEIILKIERGKEILEKRITPRISPPEGEGPIGVVLVRTEIKKYPLFLAIWQGIKSTFNLSFEASKGYFVALKQAILKGKNEIEVVGPVGIFKTAWQATKIGPKYFLNFLATLSVYLAIVNALPIPPLDGGKVLFLMIEAVRKRPISPKVEAKITALFFGLLLLISVLVTIKDIIELF